MSYDFREAVSDIICSGVHCAIDGCECDVKGKCVYNELDTRALVGIARRRFAIKKKEYCDNPYIYQLNEMMAIIDKEFPRKGVVV